MITGKDELGLLLRDKIAMAEYSRAVRALKLIGLDRVLRSIGEPTDVEYSDERSMQVLALEGAERKGWFDALNTVFELEAFAEINEVNRKYETPEFGANQILRERGYDPETTGEEES